MTSIEQRYKGRLAKETAQEFDETNPVTDLTERKKSRQFLDIAQLHRASQL